MLADIDVQLQADAIRGECEARLRADSARKQVTLVRCCLPAIIMSPMTERLRYYSVDSISSIVERKSAVVTHLVSLSTSRAKQLHQHQQQQPQHADTSISVIHAAWSINSRPDYITSSTRDGLRQASRPDAIARAQGSYILLGHFFLLRMSGII